MQTSRKILGKIPGSFVVKHTDSVLHFQPQLPEQYCQEVLGHHLGDPAQR